MLGNINRNILGNLKYCKVFKLTGKNQPLHEYVCVNKVADEMKVKCALSYNY